MLPDFGWSELLVIAIILVVVVGPKDLPKMLRTFGKTTANLRKMAGDFRRQFDEALKEADLGDVQQIAKDMKSLDPRGQIKEVLSPLGKIGQDIDKELKKATSEVQKTATPVKKDVPTPAVEAKSSETAPQPEPVNLTAAQAPAEPKPASKRARKPAAKSTSSTASTATKKAPARRAATKTAASKEPAAKSALAAKPRSAAAKPKATPKTKSATTETKKTSRAKTAAKAAETAGKDES